MEEFLLLSDLIIKNPQISLMKTHFSNYCELDNTPSQILTKKNFIKMIINEDIYSRETFFKKLKLSEANYLKESDAIINLISTQLNNSMRTLLDTIKVKIVCQDNITELYKLSVILAGKLSSLKRKIFNYNNYMSLMNIANTTDKKQFIKSMSIRSTKYFNDSSTEKEVHTNSSISLWFSLILVENNSQTIYVQTRLNEITDCINPIIKRVAIIKNILDNNIEASPRKSNLKKTSIEVNLNNSNSSKEDNNNIKDDNATSKGLIYNSAIKNKKGRNTTHMVGNNSGGNNTTNDSKDKKKKIKFKLSNEKRMSNDTPTNNNIKKKAILPEKRSNTLFQSNVEIKNLNYLTSQTVFDQIDNYENSGNIQGKNFLEDFYDQMITSNNQI